MKKVLLGSLAALFAVAMLVTSCDEDDITKNCVDCTDGDQTYEVCWKKGSALDFTNEMLDFYADHPNATCEEVDTP